MLYAERRAALIESIGNEFGRTVHLTGTEAGMHLSLAVKGIQDREIATLGAKQKLWLTPLSSCYLRHPSQAGFIMGFGSTSVGQIPKAVRKLRELMK